MKITQLTVLIIGFFIALLWMNPCMAQQLPKSDFLDPQNAAPAKHGEEEAYAGAQQALNSNQYAEAVSAFGQVAKMGGRRAEGALYWKAYAQNKLAQRGEALATLAELRKSYPQSRYVKEADVLELDIKRASGQPSNPEVQPDDDLKLLALNSLMNSGDEARALPILEKFLSGNSSVKLKDRALFVLSQSGSPKAQELLEKTATGQAHPELQSKAIRYLGMEGGRASQRLENIYSSSKDPEIKKTVLHSLMVSGDKAQVFNIAQKESSPELKIEAIHQLGVMGAHDELRQLYKQPATPEVKESLLHSMAIGGDVQGLIDIAKTETDPEVRKKAIQGLGISGGKEAMDALLSIYRSNADKETKKQVIHSLFVHGDATDLVALARNESDPELRRELVSEISVMGSKEGNDYLMEILNK